MDEGRAKDIVYLDFSPVSYDIKIDKPVEYGLDKWQWGGTESWLNYLAENIRMVRPALDQSLDESSAGQ